MIKLEAIAAAKTFRKDADELLQRMKEHNFALKMSGPKPGEGFASEISNDHGEVIAQHTLSIRDLESCIMRQGMALKYIGTPDPYPQSKDPTSPVVEPTADGLRM